MAEARGRVGKKGEGWFEEEDEVSGELHGGKGGSALVDARGCAGHTSARRAGSRAVRGEHRVRRRARDERAPEGTWRGGVRTGAGAGAIGTHNQSAAAAVRVEGCAEGKSRGRGSERRAKRVRRRDSEKVGELEAAATNRLNVISSPLAMAPGPSCTLPKSSSRCTRSTTGETKRDSSRRPPLAPPPRDRFHMLYGWACSQRCTVTHVLHCIVLEQVHERARPSRTDGTDPPSRPTDLLVLLLFLVRPRAAASRRRLAPPPRAAASELGRTLVADLNERLARVGAREEADERVDALVEAVGARLAHLERARPDVLGHVRSCNMVPVAEVEDNKALDAGRLRDEVEVGGKAGRVGRVVVGDGTADCYAER